MKNPADETMPELVCVPRVELEAMKDMLCEYIAKDNAVRVDYDHHPVVRPIYDLLNTRTTPTAPALDREAVREDTQDKRVEALLHNILVVLGVHDLNINSRGLLEGYIKAALSAKPDADIIGKMEGLKNPERDDYSPYDTVDSAEEARNEAIDQCIALVKQGAKVREA